MYLQHYENPETHAKKGRKEGRKKKK